MLLLIFKYPFVLNISLSQLSANLARRPLFDRNASGSDSIQCMGNIIFCFEVISFDGCLVQFFSLCFLFYVFNIIIFISHLWFMIQFSIIQQGEFLFFFVNCGTINTEKKAIFEALQLGMFINLLYCLYYSTVV